MSEDPKNDIVYIFNKDLEKLVDERDVTQEKLDIAIEALEHLESAVWYNSQEGAEEAIEEKTQIAHDALIKINKIK